VLSDIFRIFRIKKGAIVMSHSDFLFNIKFNNIISVIAYTTARLKKIREVDLIYLFKILYFADKEHIKNYGRPILEDNYVAMANGPVPSFVYDLIKGIRGDGIKTEKYQKFYDAFTVYNNFFIDNKIEPDLDFISKSDIDCINLAIDTYGNWDSDRLSSESHDEAWKKAYHSYDNVMKLEDVVRATGANEELIKYILDVNETKNATFLLSK